MHRKSQELFQWASMKRDKSLLRQQERLWSVSEEWYPNFQNIVSSSGSPRKRNIRFDWLLFLYPFLRKEDDHLAKAKYTKGKDGYFATKVWDGTHRNEKKQGAENRHTLFRLCKNAEKRL